MGNSNRERNVTGVMLVRHAEDEKKYLYDYLETKEETSSPLESEDCTV